jgi:hypothetical protein
MTWASLALNVINPTVGNALNMLFFCKYGKLWLATNYRYRQFAPGILAVSVGHLCRRNGESCQKKDIRLTQRQIRLHLSLYLIKLLSTKAHVEWSVSWRDRCIHGEKRSRYQMGLTVGAWCSRMYHFPHCREMNHDISIV